MASSESWEMLERWKAEHPELPGSGGGPAASPRPRPRLVAAPDPAPRSALAEQLEMIEQWQRQHPSGMPTRVASGAGVPARAAGPQADSGPRGVALTETSLSVLSAFIIGAIIGGIAMTIITGIALWGFSGG